jgi:hypothetical protein
VGLCFHGAFFLTRFETSNRRESTESAGWASFTNRRPGLPDGPRPSTYRHPFKYGPTRFASGFMGRSHSGVWGRASYDRQRDRRRTHTLVNRCYRVSVLRARLPRVRWWSLPSNPLVLDPRTSSAESHIEALVGCNCHGTCTTPFDCHCQGAADTTYIGVEDGAGKFAYENVSPSNQE